MTHRRRGLRQSRRSESSEHKHSSMTTKHRQSKMNVLKRLPNFAQMRQSLLTQLYCLTVLEAQFMAMLFVLYPEFANVVTC